ncbi:TRAM domain-containing protein [Candidatus Woesearchaeota archaeon]|nr:TRAM domain-containing protein [Candidatus Woesearchaeota archaeon]
MYGNNNYGGFRPQRSFAPVKVGEELDVKIEAVGEKGDGIAKKRGFVLFVPNTNEGDEVRVRVTKVLKKLGFAEVIGKAQGTPAQEPAPEQPAEEAPQEDLVPEGEASENFGEEEQH